MGFALRLWSKNKHSSNMHYLTLNKPERSLFKCHRIHAITLELSHIQFLLLEVKNQEGKWSNLDSQVFN